MSGSLGSAGGIKSNSVKLDLMELDDFSDPNDSVVL